MTRLILASASPARRAVLQAAGVHPLVRVSQVDEDAVAAALPPDSPPETVVVELARAKAAAVAAELTAGTSTAGTLTAGTLTAGTGGVGWLDDADTFDGVVVGCDSMLWIDEQLQGKPHTVDVARERWQQQAGRSGELLTGHCVLRMQDARVLESAVGCGRTTVRFGRPNPGELENYLATGEPLAVAGAFTLDGLGGWFVEGIDGDPSSVIGIGLPLLRRLLREVGVDVTELWRDR